MDGAGDEPLSRSTSALRVPALGTSFWRIQAGIDRCPEPASLRLIMAICYPGAKFRGIGAAGTGCGASARSLFLKCRWALSVSPETIIGCMSARAVMVARRRKCVVLAGTPYAPGCSSFLKQVNDLRQGSAVSRGGTRCYRWRRHRTAETRGVSRLRTRLTAPRTACCLRAACLVLPDFPSPRRPLC